MYNIFTIYISLGFVEILIFIEFELIDIDVVDCIFEFCFFI